ncbi:8703_t:CDS:2 [Funneliformis caledonium]|uniref:8703_t:CDS:1 n=1 Tax=Funneliformis caledonium TaxID=1117310 RepID=A0A9N9D3U7_9GLOM|nr:8703_t:CDS:2 [Funneliformis caledonium]
MKIHGVGLFQKSLGMHGDWSFNVFRLIPIEQDLNYKNKYDLNEPHYRVNFSYAYPSEIDIKESDGNKVILHKLWELVPLTDPNGQAKYPFITYNPVKRRNCEILTHRLNNNAIEDAYVVSQALLNNSSGNYISCI